MIRIRTMLESDTPHLPELAPLVRRRVEIVVTADPAAPTVTPGSGDWAALEAAARGLQNSDYDWDAWREARDAEAAP